MSRLSPISLVADALDCEISTLSAESGLNKHPKWDSLGHVGVIIALEKHYGVPVNDDTIRRYERMEAIMALFRRLEEASLGFDSRWETGVYGRGRMLNRYPSEVVVSFVFTSFPVDQRSQRKVLDLGCGAGNNVCFLAREGFDVVGVDGSRTAIDFARRRLADEGLKADLKVMDFSRLELAGASIDCVIDRCALTHNRRAMIERTLDEVRRVLRPGGLLFSQIYSARIADREFGHPLGDGSYDVFSAGYFANLGLTFFAGREDLTGLYGNRFEERSIHHVISEDGDGRVATALWNTVWRRP